MVKSGTFREDLYYRLNVVNIRIPPLRERPGDIPMLVNHFIKKYCTSMSRDMISIDPAAMKHLESFEYPGNVRELENMIERAIVVGSGKVITLKDLPMGREVISSSIESLEELEKKHIARILEKYNWNISHGARALGVDRATLYNKIRKYKLKQE
jgi:transcriptional regulator with PAS, ATPase and Fis domain